jgi:hypothetical protein
LAIFTSKTPIFYQKHLENTIFHLKNTQKHLKNTDFPIKKPLKTQKHPKTPFFTSKTPQKHHFPTQNPHFPIKNPLKNTHFLFKKKPFSYVTTAAAGRPAAPGPGAPLPPAQCQARPAGAQGVAVCAGGGEAVGVNSHCHLWKNAVFLVLIWAIMDDYWLSYDYFGKFGGFYSKFW